MKRPQLLSPEVVMPSNTVDPLTTSTPYSDATQTKKHSANHIKRPMNAFMVWSMLHRRNIIAKNPDAHNATISKNLGKFWETLSIAEKQPFVDEAKQLKHYHKLEYPEYTFKPKPRVRKTTETRNIDAVEKRRFDSKAEDKIDIQSTFYTNIPKNKTHKIETRKEEYFLNPTAVNAERNFQYNNIKQLEIDSTDDKYPSFNILTPQNIEDVFSYSPAKVVPDSSCKDSYFSFNSLPKGRDFRIVQHSPIGYAPIAPWMPNKPQTEDYRNHHGDENGTSNYMGPPQEMISQKPLSSPYPGMTWHGYVGSPLSYQDLEFRDLTSDGQPLTETPITEYHQGNHFLEKSYTKSISGNDDRSYKNSVDNERDFSYNRGLSMDDGRDFTTNKASSMGDKKNSSINDDLHWTCEQTLDDQSLYASTYKMRKGFGRPSGKEIHNCKPEPLHQFEQMNDQDGKFHGDNWSALLQEAPDVLQQAPEVLQEAPEVVHEGPFFNDETGDMKNVWLQPTNSFMDTFSSLSDITRTQSESECADWFNQTFN